MAIDFHPAHRYNKINENKVTDISCASSQLCERSKNYEKEDTGFILRSGYAVGIWL